MLSFARDCIIWPTPVGVFHSRADKKMSIWGLCQHGLRSVLFKQPRPKSSRHRTFHCCVATRFCTEHRVQGMEDITYVLYTPTCEHMYTHREPYTPNTLSHTGTPHTRQDRLHNQTVWWRKTGFTGSSWHRRTNSLHVLCRLHNWLP